MTRSTVAVAAAGAALVLGAGLATADEWPVQQPNTVIQVVETYDFVLPSDPNYWNPTERRDRLDSPYGTGTRIVCEAYRGRTGNCWQADDAGNPHKLLREDFSEGGITGSAQQGHTPTKYTFPR
ncbi:hypothetical protein D5S18_33030 [Nocardia panacis]|uniref:Uncharacterized protein n=1 Tax=Nocardia panacis TaxID=2340916 RepID=A0A3A4JWE2_9NOCA|nr:hypothetical protein [Nocardia panacis]RJO68252.1 hypothetical protein D5S18_33030 [Nocardia panacis]